MLNLSWMANLENITFSMCGLDVERNMLCAPVCDCGCGGKLRLVLNSKEEVMDLCGQLVYEDECDYCGVFALFRNGTVVGAVCSGDDVNTLEFTNKADYKEIGELADNLELHCYGLIVETMDGSWKIIEE